MINLDYWGEPLVVQEGFGLIRSGRQYAIAQLNWGNNTDILDLIDRTMDYFHGEDEVLYELNNYEYPTKFMEAAKLELCS